MAVSFPITWADTWHTTSGITGLTLPGMIEEPFCNSGMTISEIPERGPDPIQRRSLAILVSDTATDLRAPDASTETVAVGLGLERVGGRHDLEPGVGDQPRAHARRELGMRVQAVADGGAAKRDLADAGEAVAHPPRTLAHLRGVAAELLAEGHRTRRPSGGCDRT